MVAELVLCQLGHSIVRSSFKSYTEPDPYNVLNLLKSISAVIEPFCDTTHTLRNLATDFYEYRDML